MDGKRRGSAMALGLGVFATWMLIWLLSDPGAIASTDRVAAIITVCPDGTCDFVSIQAAVDAAASGDTIKVAAGVYAGVSVRPRNDVTHIGTVTQVVFIDKNVSIRGGYSKAFNEPPDPVGNRTRIDPQGRGRGLYITGNISPTIEGLHISGGDATGLGGLDPHSDWDAGGGVYVISATAIISNCWVFSNTAGYVFGSFPAYGGGLFLLSSETTVANSDIFSNTAYEGGGFYLDSGAITVAGNRITANAANDGAGLRVGGAAVIRGNSILSNTATRAGGALLLYVSSAQIEANLIKANRARSSGGGVSASWSDGATLSANDIISNTAGRGGGLYLYSSDAQLRANTVVSNTSNGLTLRDGGGGIYVDDSAVTLAGNTVISNTASSHGGGIYVTDGDGATLAGNTLADNTAAGFGGGLFLFYNDASLDGNTVIGNVGDEGGGMYVDWSDATLTNNVVVDNRAVTGAPGLYIRRSAPGLLHNTIAHNTGGDGSGIYITDYAAAVSRVDLANTILVSHTVGLTITAGNTATLNAGLWFANDTDAAGAGTTQHSSDTDGDPRFMDPGAGDFHIRADSEARDKGVNVFVTSDIDGQLRPQGSGYDIGADEFHPLPGLAVAKQASPNPARSGEALTYTLTVTNTGNMDLRATITDTLPEHVTPTGTLTWRPATITLNGVWRTTIMVTVEAHHLTPLVNVMQATSREGATGVYTTTTPLALLTVYLPSVLRSQ